jgi:cytochrome b6-f complex iron-sulfur subunit
MAACVPRTPREESTMPVDVRLVQPEPSRRAFCIRTCQAVSLAGTAALLHACGGGSSPTAPSPPAPAMPVLGGSFANGVVTVSVGAGPLATVGGAALVQSSGGSFLVVRTGEAAFVALTATCTHEACTITGRQNDAFVCPCHGSRFSNTGAVLNGPATRALPQFAAQLSGDVLTIVV